MSIMKRYLFQRQLSPVKWPGTTKYSLFKQQDKKKRFNLSVLRGAAKAKKPLGQVLVSVATSWVRQSVLLILRNIQCWFKRISHVESYGGRKNGICTYLGSKWECSEEKLQADRNCSRSSKIEKKKLQQATSFLKIWVWVFWIQGPSPQKWRL